MHESGRLGTSNSGRSALPTQFRNGRCSFFSPASASCSPATSSSGAPSAPQTQRCSKRCGAGSAAAWSIPAIRKLAASSAELLSLERGQEACVVAIGSGRVLGLEPGAAPTSGRPARAPAGIRICIPV